MDAFLFSLSLWEDRRNEKVLKTSLQNYCTYNDLWMRLVGSVVISFPVVIMRESDIASQLLNPSFYFDMAISALSAFLLWTLVRLITIILDKKYSWYADPFLRTILQIVWGVIFISGCTVLITYIQFEFIYRQSLIDTEWLILEFPLVVVTTILINAYYGIYFLIWNNTQIQQNEESAPGGTYRNEIVCLKGNSSILVRIEDITCIYKKGQVNFVYTVEGENLILSETSLEEIYNSLNPEYFFRANRQYIISKSKIDEFKSIENGKIQVQIKGNSELIIISQKSASKFRNWLK